MIRNPILPGFHPDPCLCRRGDDLYIACSTFEWMPGIPIYHSRDLKHWELYAHALTDDTTVRLEGLPSAKGIWAPCLTYCEADGLFYMVYGIMESMNARYFDIDNFVITAPDPRGPWSAPVYLHSAGFDASMFHDTDGRKYVVSLEWENRENYEKPGPICIAEYDPVQKCVIGYPKAIWRGGTDRGCLEAPHLTRRGDWYYLMCAEGGTGYNHSVTMARSRSPFGPYEGDPDNPILTSTPGVFSSRKYTDHLQPWHYNAGASLQKAGHGSYVDLPNGETWLAYLCSRPFVPELRCTLGREAALRKMKWTDDGWLRTADGSVLPRLEEEEPALPECPLPAAPVRDDFDEPDLSPYYSAPRMLPSRFASLTDRPGWVRLRGQESLTSLHHVSLLARRLTGLQIQISTRMDFDPELPQHAAGLVLYYDNMDWFFLQKYYSETLGGPALLVTVMDNGTRTQALVDRIPAPSGPVWLRLTIRDRQSQFSWSANGVEYRNIGPVCDTSTLSDEYCSYGEFTGTMAGLFCVDRMFRRKCADFDWFEFLPLQEAPEHSSGF